MKNLSVVYDPASDLVAPVSLLPSQLALRSAQFPAPEMRLVAAVLEDAVNCIVSNTQAHSRHRRQEFSKACQWIWEEGSAWPFAFRNVCDVLGLNPTAVRERLLSVIDTSGKSQQGGVSCP